MGQERKSRRKWNQREKNQREKSWPLSSCPYFYCFYNYLYINYILIITKRGVDCKRLFIWQRGEKRENFCQKWRFDEKWNGLFYENFNQESNDVWTVFHRARMRAGLGIIKSWGNYGNLMDLNFRFMEKSKKFLRNNAKK